MNLRQWKKLAKQNISKVGSSASNGDVLLLEFNQDKITLDELKAFYGCISESVKYPVVCVPINKMFLQNVSLDGLKELREEVDKQIIRKVKMEMVFRDVEHELID